MTQEKKNKQMSLGLENDDDLRVVINLYDTVNDKVHIPIPLFDVFDIKSDN